jgi:putative membrane protein
MNSVAQTAALLAALIHIVVFPMESLLIGRPAVQRFLRVRVGDIADIRLWAFAVGTMNLLAGLGTILGLIILHTGNEVVGETIVIAACVYMFLAGLIMGVSDMLGFWPRKGASIPGVVGESLAPLIALFAAALW